MCENSFLTNPEFWFWFAVVVFVMAFLFWYLEKDSGPTFLELDYMHKFKCDRRTARKHLRK